MNRWIMGIALGILAIPIGGCTAIRTEISAAEGEIMTDSTTRRALLELEELPNWKLTAWRPEGRMWSLDKGVFDGHCSNTWVGHSDAFADLRLQCEILYDGYGGGDICVRGDRDADKTWEHGYNFAIGHPGRPSKTTGRIILVNPKGHHERYIEFPVNQWTKLTISAIGNKIEAYVSPDKRLTLEDREARFPKGQITLSDQSCRPGDECNGSGHIKFRNLVVEPVTEGK